MDDLISKQRALDIINSELNGWLTDDERLHLEGIGIAIQSLPSTPRWIPVTERLPKLGEKVLVSTKNTVFTQVFKCIYGTPDRWGWEHHTIKKVTAWMPLPKPWKGEE